MRISTLPVLFVLAYGCATTGTLVAGGLPHTDSDPEVEDTGVESDTGDTDEDTAAPEDTVVDTSDTGVDTAVPTCEYVTYALAKANAIYYYVDGADAYEIGDNVVLGTWGIARQLMLTVTGGD